MTDGDTVVGERFTDAVLAGHQWHGVTFDHCDFTGADLHGASTRNCRFVHCDFGRADLAASRHTATAFHTCTFDSTNFSPTPGWHCPQVFTRLARLMVERASDDGRMLCTPWQLAQFAERRC